MGEINVERESWGVASIGRERERVCVCESERGKKGMEICGKGYGERAGLVRFYP